MQLKYRDLFTTIRTEGALLPPDLLQRVADGDNSIGGLRPEDYHLVAGEKINEATNRSWNRLVSAWRHFQDGRAGLREDDAATAVTRERWLQPLFQELGYGRLVAARAAEIGGKSYPVSHHWQHAPIHLVGCGVDMDRRTAGVAGAARTSPHGLVQEYLNRSDDSLWGFVSNGLKLRILRDNASFARQAYVEFDLVGMMDGEVYADFVLLWLLCHQSRVESERPEQCWLEKWSRFAQEQGTRALEQLRDGVEIALNALGAGFLRHASNEKLRDKLRTGELDSQDYYRQLLRLVYRLIFLFAAEDRDLLLLPAAAALARERYLRHYSTARFRKLARRLRGSRHSDLYECFRLVMEKLGSEEGCPDLALPALGSFLFSRRATPALDGCKISNHDFLEAVRALAVTSEGKTSRIVDYKNLGAEELGSVYESLLELHPAVNTDAGTFALSVSSGHERKTTGSYYTPTSLITCLLDSALDPVIEEAVKKEKPEQALLSLKICDPACGSGHFLIAAAHRLAKRLAAVRTGDDEPSPEAMRTALRDVIGRCIYGVDVNEMAVELCKVALWMEALEPGKPLSFLDHRIKCGNSLLGTTSALIERGIPDETFNPIEGDDRKVAAALKKRNRIERAGQMALPMVAVPAKTYGGFGDAVTYMDSVDDSSASGIREKEEQYERLSGSKEYRHAWTAADAWCAAFVWKKAKDARPAITQDIFRQLQQSPDRVPAEVRREIERLSRRYNFFHWHLAFPDVFRVPDDLESAENPEAGWNGGFDVVLGNPPWEHTELKEKEWFANRHPDIASAPGARRKSMIEALSDDDPALYADFKNALREHDAIGHFVANSSRYPLCGRGRINTYAIFAETKRMLISPTGRVGAIVPSGIATDDTTKYFFRDLVGNGSLVSLLDFENREGFFPDVDSRMKFSLLTLTGIRRPAKAAEFVFFAQAVEDLDDPERRFTLWAEDIALLNPNTRTCPVFRSRRDAEITKAIYRRVPVLIKEGPPEENPWGIRFRQGLFNMTSDSRLFRTREQLESEGWRLEGNIFHRGPARYLPLYEAKMIHHFDHRWATYHGLDTRDFTAAEKSDPSAPVLPRYWVSSQDVSERLAGRWDRGWLLGWRDICRSTDERTVIASLLPRTAVGHKFPLFMIEDAQVDYIASFVTNLASFALDYVARQKIGGTSLTYFYLKQFPVLNPLTFPSACPWSYDTQLRHCLLSRLLELSYTAYDLESFARDCGYSGPPFRWDEERRFLIRCELDAAFFHLYLPAIADGQWKWARKAEGAVRDETPEELAELKKHFPTPRDAAAYIMDTFPIVKRKDEARYGEYRTKRTILEIYDAMAEAIRTGQPYETRLDPPPGPPAAGLPAWPPGFPRPSTWPVHIHPPKGCHD